MKICIGCKTEKPLTDFHGTQGWRCKKCVLERVNNWNDTNPEKRRGIDRKSGAIYRAKWGVTIGRRFSKWKHRAKEAGLDFTLDLNEIKSRPLICHYTGISLTTQANQENTLSLDRKDSTKGYTPDNVVFCSWDINNMKASFSYDKFIKLCRLVSKTNPE